MSGPHPDIGPELRQLAQAILDRLDPAVRSAAAMATAAGPGKCQQVWCPVCALAALVSGEQHPMLTVIAEHSVALMAMIRAMVGDLDAPQPPPDGTAPGSGDAARTDAAGPTRYQPIPITVED
ncbi:MAG: hypothetical protein KDB72_23515 [Mycobacterium sp.]|nr:hypothetical protein [Mycobacterium sp.]